MCRDSGPPQLGRSWGYVMLVMTTSLMGSPGAGDIFREAAGPAELWVWQVLPTEHILGVEGGHHLPSLCIQKNR